jgi:ribosomal protein S18 acetylase RimI-like enzyme
MTLSPRSPESISIRTFELQDWTRVCEIHDLARPDELRGSCDPKAFVPILNDPQVQDLKLSQKFVAEINTHIVGFVGVNQKCLGWLYIDPAFYQRGVGKRLLAKGLEAIGPGAYTIVLAGNQDAINLYLGAGFKEVRQFNSDNEGYPVVCLRLEHD